MTETTPNQERNLVFISHANVEDNYFAAWLAAKLNVLGYNAWVDVDDFNAGDAFFTTISPLIKDEAIRFIAVNSCDYIRKSLDQNSGVSRELNTSITVKGIENFICPIRLDDSDYNEFPAHYASWDAIDFYGNWQDGLVKLVKQFEKDGIPKPKLNPTPEKEWFRAIKNENKVIQRQETYYTNWFRFQLPQYIYIHSGYSTKKEDYFSVGLPSVLEANNLICFFDEKTAAKHFSVRQSKRLITADFIELDSLILDSSFTLVEPKKKITRLLNQCIRDYFGKSDLSYWKKRNLNYFLPDKSGSKSVSLRKRYGKGSRALHGIKTVILGGKKRTIQWHYAIRLKANLHPFPHFELFYTLVFTNEFGKGTSMEHSRTLRRSVPADWYNRKWFETMLAAMLRLSGSDDAEHIKIKIGQRLNLEIENMPTGNHIEAGYIEP